MRIALVLDRVSARGGADLYAHDLVHALAAAPGVELHLLHGHDDGSGASLLAAARSCTRVASLADRFDAPRHLAAATRLRDAIRSTGADVAVVQNVMAPRLLEAALAATPASLCIVQDHRAFCPGRGKVLPDETPCHEPWGAVCDVCFRSESGQLDVERRDERLAAVIARLAALAASRRLVVLSRSMAAELDSAGLQAPPVVVIPPAAPSSPSPFVAPLHSGRVAIVGRIAWQKGSLHALRALAGAPKVTRISFLGDGPARAELEDLARSLSGSVVVEVSGWMPREQLHERLRDADVVVMPSLWAEPFGMAGLEAAALGRPVVAYEVGGIGEWLEDGQTGILVPPGRPDRLAAATASLLAHPRAAEALARRAAAIVRERFSWDRFEATWRELIRSARSAT